MQDDDQSNLDEPDTCNKNKDDNLCGFREGNKGKVNSTTKKKRAKVFAQIAVDRLLPQLEYSKRYDTASLPLPENTDRGAAYEWYRYRKIEVELKGLYKNSVQITEWITDRRNILRNEMDAIEEWIRDNRDTPTTGNQKVLESFPTKLPTQTIPKGSFEAKQDDTLSDTERRVETNITQTSTAENYFIRRGDNWRVRFKGGSETDIKHGKPIRTLVEYIINRGEVLNRAKIYIILHGGTPALDNKRNFPGVDGVNDKKNSFTQDPSSTTDLLDMKAKHTIEDRLRDLHKDAESHIQKGREDDCKNADNEITKITDFLRKKYNATVTDNGKVQWGSATEHNEYKKYSSLTQKHLTRAIKTIGQKESLHGLAEHLETFLLKNKDCYNPPPSFPPWDITI